MEMKNIKNIIKIFEDSTLTKLDLEVEDFAISMEKGNANNNVISYIPQQGMAVPTALANANEEKPVESGEWVKAPFVGTYYESSSQGAQPFISEGKKVAKGDTLCIIEAMKSMNEIKATKSGVIKKINVNNEEMVQFDQDMILIGD